MKTSSYSLFLRRSSVLLAKNHLEALNRFRDTKDKSQAAVTDQFFDLRTEGAAHQLQKSY